MLYQSVFYIVIEASTYSPYISLIVSLKDPFLFSHSYLVVGTVIYLYALPIDHLLYSYSSLCLSCNLSQA